MAIRSRNNADEALALAISSGMTVRDAARQVGVAERTAHRRWADPEFKKRVTQLRDEAIERGLNRLAEGMGDAASALQTLLLSEVEKIKLNAAKALIDSCLKTRDAVTLEQRLAEVEKALKGSQGNKSEYVAFAADAREQAEMESNREREDTSTTEGGGEVAPGEAVPPAPPE